MKSIEEGLTDSQPKRRGRPPRKVSEEKRSDALEQSMDSAPKTFAVGLTATIEQRNPSKTIPEQIAGNSVSFYNWKWPGAEKDFPIEPWLRTVKHCFPYAKGGMILADYPMLANERAACERKAKILKEKGFRYIVVHPDTTLHEAREILG